MFSIFSYSGSTVSFKSSRRNRRVVPINPCELLGFINPVSWYTRLYCILFLWIASMSHSFYTHLSLAHFLSRTFSLNYYHIMYWRRKKTASITPSECETSSFPFHPCIVSKRHRVSIPCWLPAWWYIFLKRQ